MSKLYIIPTPIGNLEDITLRSIRILKEVDFILAEDTRTSLFLLKHHGIATKVFSYHQHNEHEKLDLFIEKINAANSVALISDAGTPGISDAGFLLIRACIQNNITIECLPGATAFVPALIQSGIPCDRFHFEGFLPHKKGRQTKLTELSQLASTIILYESPHRLLKTLEQLISYFGTDRQVSVSRELTKIHEETIRGTLAELIAHFKNSTIKGEIVIIIEGGK